MKNWKILVLLTFSLGLIKPLVAFSEKITPEVVGDITYLTGGVGRCDARTMRSLAKDYLIDIVFIQRLKHNEEFLANVKVQIQDKHRHLLIDVVTEGPYLFVNLPQGKYLIVAEHNGVVKQQWVGVGTNKGRKVVFWWPIITTQP